jgi:gamma-glutamylcyclotransferase (GGCT)/AIG2-like uncharacterized protein YtfP
MEGATYVGRAIVHGRLYHIGSGLGLVSDGKLVVRGRMHYVQLFPGLVLDHREGEVRGELFEVTAEHLAALDEFEGTAFERLEHETLRYSGGLPSRAWIWTYRGEVKEEQRIKGGDWLDFVCPRTTPVFVWIAWSPVLFLLVGILSASLMRGSFTNLGSPIGWRAFPALTLIAPAVMVGGGLLAIKRRERAEGCAALAVFLGIVGLTILGLLLVAGLLSR